jgi:hypothetical protein
MIAPDKLPAGTTSGTPQVLLAHHLKQLKLPTVLREYDKVARECARDGVDHPRYLLRLIELELIERERRTVERRIRAARFPAVKSFDTFDFTAIPGLNKMLVLELARCEYILRRENIIALGNSGTGKTHVALALGLAACQKGFSVAFTTASSLVNQLLEARDERIHPARTADQVCFRVADGLRVHVLASLSTAWTRVSTCGSVGSKGLPTHSSVSACSSWSGSAIASRNSP